MRNLISDKADQVKLVLNRAAKLVVNTDQFRQLQQRINSLPPRDQLALKMLSIFLVSVFVLLGVFLPARQFADSEQHKYQEAKSLLAWMYANESAARQIASAPQVGGDGQSLLNTINVAAQNRAISIKRIEPEGQRNSNVWLENAPYEKVMLWLFDLQEQYKIRIKQITIEKQPNAGYVNVHVVFGV